MTFHLPDTKFVFVRRLRAQDEILKNAGKHNTTYLTRYPNGEEDLQLLHEIGAIHKVQGSEHEDFLKRELFKRHGITDTTNIYLAPVKKDTGGDSAIHKRAKFITLPNGTVYQFKGIGNNSSEFEDRTNETTINTIHGKATIPFQPRPDATTFGAYNLGHATNYYILSRQLSQAWKVMHKQSPKIAQYLDAPKEAPFALPIENFEYLDLIARKNNRRGKSRYTRVKSEHQKVLTIIKGTAAQERILHLASPQATQEEKETYYRKVATYYKIKNFNSKKDEHREALFRKITNRAIAAYITIWSHSPHTMHRVVDGELQNILGSKDFNGIEFFDTDDVDQKHDRPIDTAGKQDQRILSDIVTDTIAALNLKHKSKQLRKDFKRRFNHVAKLMDETHPDL